MATMANAPATQPSSSLLGNLRAELMRHVPFGQMLPAHVDQFLSGAQQAYYAPGETVLSPADGVPQHLILIRSGHITGRVGGDDAASGFEYDAGDIFPVGAVMGERPVAATYVAHADVFCLLLPVLAVRQLAGVSKPFSDFLGHRALRYLELSRQAVAASYSAQALHEQTLETPLGQLALKSPVAVAPDTPLLAALTLMHERHIGSVMVCDPPDHAVGILTRHDILGRITLARVGLETPIAQVMTHPLRTLDVGQTAQDAALLMSRHGIRHVPVTRDGRLVGLVSERDLFALQRLSIKHVSSAIRAARDVPALALAAADIRRFARSLLGQGVAARQLTQLISHLNDVLTEQLLEMVARQHGLDFGRACWLAFGSEGRSEQTIATDQDNGLVFDSEDPQADRPRWLAFATEVNAALDACGYPLCKGLVMASNPKCCLSLQEWRQRFADWMERGAPEDLLNASIFFDLRALYGQAALAQELADMVAQRASALPRFIKQMADNALRSRPPLSWLGSVETRAVEGRGMVDLKHSGTAIFVDVARLYALAHGIAETGTRARFEALGSRLKVAPTESQAWVAAFEFLQMLRLRVQMAQGTETAATANLVELASLNDIDQRMLKESFRVARRLQQKMELDYQR